MRRVKRLLLFFPICGLAALGAATQFIAFKLVLW
jgi:hypothetical protein